MKNNDNYRVIANVMEHPEFRYFYNKYFSTKIDIKTTILFLKLYEKIEKDAPVELNGYQKISILDKIINDSKIRQEISINFCNEWENNNMLE